MYRHNRVSLQPNTDHVLFDQSRLYFLLHHSCRLENLSFQFPLTTSGETRSNFNTTTTTNHSNPRQAKTSRPATEENRLDFSVYCVYVWKFHSPVSFWNCFKAGRKEVGILVEWKIEHSITYFTTIWFLRARRLGSELFCDLGSRWVAKPLPPTHDSSVIIHGPCKHKRIENICTAAASIHLRARLLLLHRFGRTDCDKVIFIYNVSYFDPPMPQWVAIGFIPDLRSMVNPAD